MAKDIFHQHVREALEKIGWTITHDPFPLKWKKKGLEIDLGAEMIIAAEKDKKTIAVEIKSFLSHSRMYDFHVALGQYRNYLRLLNKSNQNAFYILPFLKTLRQIFLTALSEEKQSKRKI